MDNRLEQSLSANIQAFDSNEIYCNDFININQAKSYIDTVKYQRIRLSTGAYENQKVDTSTVKKCIRFLTSQYNKDNSPAWKLRNLKPEQLAEFIKNGNTVKPGINKDGAYNFNYLFLDIDTGKLEDTLSNKYTDQALFTYYTPSYIQDTNEKHRIVFKLSESLNYSEYFYVYKQLIESYIGCDKSTSDSERIFFGAVDSEVNVINLKNVLRVKPLLEGFTKKDVQPNNKASFIIPTQTSDPGIKEQEISITSQVLNYYYELIFKNLLNEDITQLYCLHSHHFQDIGVTVNDASKGIIGRWNGSNPFSVTDTSKTSFLVSYYKDKMPVWYDRSINFEAKKNIDETTRNGGSFLQYWFSLKQLTTHKWFNKPFNLKSVSNDIAKYFNVEPFKFGGSSDSVNFKEVVFYLNEVLENKLYCIANQSQELYFGFDQINEYWITARNHDFYKTFIQETLEEKYGWDIANDSKLIDKLKKYFKDSWHKTIKNLIDEHEDYIPFLNGLFNLKTKKIEKNVGQGYNKFLHPYNFEYVNDNDPVIKEFLNYFPAWLKDEVKANFLIKLLIIEAHKIGYKHGFIPGLVGTSGAGKSTFLDLLSQLLGEYSFSPRAELLLSKGNKHATASLEGKTTILIEELKGDYKSNIDISFFKNYTGKFQGKSKKMTIERKFENTRQIDFKGSFIFDCEDMIYLDPAIEGYFRRFKFIYVGNECKAPELANKLQIILDNTEKIYCWLLQQDGNQALADFKELCEHDTIKLQSNIIRYENDTIHQFFDECLILSNDKKDKLSTQVIYDYYAEYCNTIGVKPKSKIGFSKNFRKLLISDKLSKKWNFDDKQVINVGGSKRLNGYYGICLQDKIFEDF